MYFNLADFLAQILNLMVNRWFTSKTTKVPKSSFPAVWYNQCNIKINVNRSNVATVEYKRHSAILIPTMLHVQTTQYHVNMSVIIR